MKETERNLKAYHEWLEREAKENFGRTRSNKRRCKVTRGNRTSFIEDNKWTCPICSKIELNPRCWIVRFDVQMCKSCWTSIHEYLFYSSPIFPRTIQWYKVCNYVNDPKTCQCRWCSLNRMRTKLIEEGHDKVAATVKRLVTLEEIKPSDIDTENQYIFDRLFGWVECENVAIKIVKYLATHGNTWSIKVPDELFEECSHKIDFKKEWTNDGVPCREFIRRVCTKSKQ